MSSDERRQRPAGSDQRDGTDFREVSAVMARLADTLAEPYSLLEVVEQLSTDVVRLLQVDGAGIMVADDQGALRFVSSSDAKLATLESLQLEHGEGPCLLAYETGEEVYADDLGGDPRFPRFGPAAAGAGLRAVHSLPMVVGATVVGATNLYQHRPGELHASQVEAARILTQAATAYVRHADEDDRSHRLNLQLQTALDSRVVLEQAKGFLAATWSVPVERAWEVLRGHARSTNRKVRAVAEDVVAGRLAPDDLAGGSERPTRR